MEKKFTVTMTYNENVFYHRALVTGGDRAKPAKKSFLGDLEVSDLLVSILAFGLYFLVTGGVDLPNRIFQSVIAWILFLTVMRSLNRMRNGSKDAARSESALRRAAKSDLSASGQEGESCSITFLDESFLVASPGIENEYRYDGVKKIRETEEFLMIVMDHSTIVPVEKAGIEEGTAEELLEFLETACGVVTEKVGTGS